MFKHPYLAFSVPAFAVSILYYPWLPSTVLEIFHCSPTASLLLYSLSLLPFPGASNPAKREPCPMKRALSEEGGKVPVPSSERPPRAGCALRWLTGQVLFLYRTVPVISCSAPLFPLGTYKCQQLSSASHKPECSALSNWPRLARDCLCISMQALGLLGRAFKPRCLFLALLC